MGMSLKRPGQENSDLGGVRRGIFPFLFPFLFSSFIFLFVIMP